MEAKNQTLPHSFPCSSKLLAAFIVMLILAFTMLSDGYASGEQFSMRIQDKTLAAVFQELTRMSGRPITFDKQWANQPINTRFTNLSLEMALAKILKNLNHVVIFEEDTIRIKIYSVVTPGEDIGQASATPYKINSSETSLPINFEQKDTREDESASEEGDDPETSDEDTENSEEAEETEPTQDTMDQKNVEGTNEEKTTGELEEADESEETSSENI